MICDKFAGHMARMTSFLRPAVWCLVRDGSHR